jgi:hypothetical protein
MTSTDEPRATRRSRRKAIRGCGASDSKDSAPDGNAARWHARGRLSFLAALPLAAIAFVAADSASAWPLHITGRATAWLGTPGPNDTVTFDQRVVVDPGYSQISDAVQTGLGQVGGPNAAGAQSLAGASHGLLGTDAGAEVLSGAGSASASTSASFRDFFEVLPQQASLLGQPGTLSFIIGVAGDGDARQEEDPFENQASASVYLAAEIGSCGFPCRFAEGMSWRTDLDDGHTIVEGQSSTTFAIFGTVPIVFGSLVRADVSLSTEASTAANGGSASAYANFGHTAWWGGILEVRNAQGDPVAYTANSPGTQIDWSETRVPVPEPGRGLMLLVGVASTIARLRTARAGRMRPFDSRDAEK